MTGAVYLCIKQFNARLGDELNLKAGDKIEVLADDSEYNDGWYMGRNVVSNKVGLFPKSFTKILQEQLDLDPSLLRSRSRRVPSAPKSGGEELAQEKTSDSTLIEIDKALHELHVSSLDPGKSQQHAVHLRSASTQSLTQDLNPLKAAEWTPKQVSSYFAIVLGFPMDVAGKFARHKITGEILFELDLAHLKELDIDSFGTRFEVNKEIEKLKQIATRVKAQGKPGTTAAAPAQKGSEPTPPAEYQRDPSPPFNNSDEDRPQQVLGPLYGLHAKSHSQLLPSAQLDTTSKTQTGTHVRNGSSASSRRMYAHLRTRSQSMENVRTFDTSKPEAVGSPSNSSFLSPRRAPEPPSASPLNNSFKFGGSPITPQANDAPPLHSLYMTRTNASSAGLGVTNGNSRPASSIYEASVVTHHRRASSGVSHRRHSSLFLFMSGNNEETPAAGKEKLQSQNLYKSPATPSKTRGPSAENSGLDKRASRLFKDPLDLTLLGDDDAIDIDDANLSPKKSHNLNLKPDDKKKDKESSHGRLKGLRSVSTQNFRTFAGLKKLKTSAFQEGIREITPDEAIKQSNFSGWMSKKSGSTLGWRSRYFTLHGTRLSYFTSLRDKREKGLIDITAHKVLPISTEGESSNSNDKYIALYAALTGFGRYCFKLVPPAPGFKKGLTFTQPKTHYFAVETQEEMRGWLKALMTATIDIDDSVPVVSSCNTPTVTLAKAQELLAKAREETRLRDEDLRAKGFLRDGEYSDVMGNSTTMYNDIATSEEASLLVGSIDDTTISSNNGGTPHQPKLSVDTQMKGYRVPSTPLVSNHSGGFASPYLLASGLLSPKLVNSGTSASNNNTPYVPKKDYFPDQSPQVLTEEIKSEASLGSPNTVFSNSNGKVVNGVKKRGNPEKMMAYTSSGSFLIKSKRAEQ